MMAVSAIDFDPNVASTLIWSLMGLVLGGMLVYLAVLAVREHRSTRRAFADVAWKLNGRYLGRGIPGGHEIAFTLAGRPASIELFPPDRFEAGRSRLTVGLNGQAPGTLHIIPDGIGQKLRTLFGARDHSIGDPEIDAKFAVRATPDSLVERVLSAGRKARVPGALRRLSLFHDPRIDVTRDMLVVQVQLYSESEARMLDLVKTGEDFLEILGLKLPASGMDLGEVEARKSAAAECQVCGTEMTGKIVRCEACRTPHHEECWNYMGRCSTYACPGKRPAP